MRRTWQAIIASFGLALILAAGAALSLPAKAASDGPTASEGIAIGGSVNNSTINNTVNKQDPAVLTAMTKIFADQMAATTEARVRAEAKAADLAQKLGFTSSAVAEFFTILGEQNVPEEKIPARLIEIATHFAQTRDELAALEPDDPQAAKLANLAKQALDAGRLTEADKLLDQAKDAELAAFRQARELAQKAQEAADRHALTAAKLLASRGNIALTQLHYADAAGAFKEAATLVPPGHLDVTADLLDNESGALYRQGDERGDNTALKQSVEIWHVVLGYRTRDRRPLDWAMTETNLGAALERLGEREIGTDGLEQAVAAYRAALAPVATYYATLEEDTRDRVSWIIVAAIQMNMGAVLETLGEREGSSARLEDAVAADRAALDEYTRDRAPLRWALTQINLGGALLTLGEREGNTARLEDAVAAYRAALEKCTRDQAPLQWALAQNNLGKALWVLGSQENGTERLKQSVAAYRASLEVRTRERVPLDWAMTENNLGIALKALGERENGTALLEEAVAAYRAALEEYTPDRVPLQWAQTLMNLGNALQGIGERGGGTPRLEEAVASYRAALQLDPLPIDQARDLFNMGLALVALERRQEALTCFKEAGVAFKTVGLPHLADVSGGWVVRLSNEINRGGPNTPTPLEHDQGYQ
jgi:tetratricopeptide (TPR) repeat protein